MKGRRSVKRERERETGRGESEEEEDWDMIRERVSKGVCMQEGGKSEREIGLYAGSPIAWAVHGVERSIGCRDRLIC